MTDNKIYIALEQDELKELLEKAAEAGATKSVQKLQDSILMGVGRSVISKLVYIIGAATVGILLWLNAHDLIKLT
jgi:hypothetical protein